MYYNLTIQIRGFTLYSVWSYKIKEVLLLWPLIIQIKEVLLFTTSNHLRKSEVLLFTASDHLRKSVVLLFMETISWTWMMIGKLNTSNCTSSLKYFQINIWFNVCRGRRNCMNIFSRKKSIYTRQPPVKSREKYSIQDLTNKQKTLGKQYKKKC